MLIRTSKGWFRVRLRKCQLGKLERDVLKAIMEIQGKLGSLFRPIHLPEIWGYASRFVIASYLGWPITDSNLRKISRITKFLRSEGYLYLNVVAAPGNSEGATRFRICKRSLKVVRLIWNSLLQKIVSPISGVSGVLKTELKEKRTEGLFEAWNRMGLARGTVGPAIS